MMKAHRYDHYVVFAWMSRDLDLRGNELLVFAILYNSCLYGNGYCDAYPLEIAELCGVTRRTATDTLDKLERNGLIQQVEISDRRRHRKYFIPGLEKYRSGGG